MTSPRDSSSDKKESKISIKYNPVVLCLKSKPDVAHFSPESLAKPTSGEVSILMVIKMIH